MTPAADNSALLRQSETSSSNRALNFLEGGGEMGARIRAFDWSSTPIGKPEAWSAALRTMVRVLLANRFPMLLWWGSDYVSIYNDAYIPILGRKHPWGLGRPVRECWSEIWDVLKPLIDTPFRGGPATWVEDIELVINRSDAAEETHFTVAYSPVPDDAPGTIGGVLATVHEITEKVIGERRGAILRELGAQSPQARTENEACLNAAAILTRHPKDIPFALLYLIDVDEAHASLAASAGLDGAPDLACPVIALDDSRQATWPLTETWISRQLHFDDKLASRFAALPVGTWPDPPNSAAIVPIRANTPHHLAGFLVAGLSSRLRFDIAYRNFLDLVASQIAATIASARAYEEEKRRAEALAEVDRAKTAFFSNVSHEFRTPLTLMIGPLESVLRSDVAVAPQVREQVETAHRNSLRLLKLVNSLLDFSRIEAGRMSASYEPVDLSAVTADLASNFRSAMEAGGLNLIVDCAPLPEPVYIDRQMWEKIVLNLLSNSFKFTFEGSVQVSLREVDAHAVLSVRDSGTGIPAHELPNIFKRFHRVEGAHGRTYEGTGIGLALIQELVKLHGGTIGVESEMGKGTAFTIAIPFGATHLPQDRINLIERGITSTGVRPDAFIGEAVTWVAHDRLSDPSGDGPVHRPAIEKSERPRVLLADDNADMRDHVTRVLGVAYDVTAVADGAAALKSARSTPPDLVISDVMMPGLDGFGLLSALRADNQLRGIPVILLSARAGEEARTEGISAGADDYLTKPFAATELVARVETTLNLQRLRREARDQFETLLNQAPIGVFLIDDGLRILQVNPTALPAFGDVGDLVGRDFGEVVYETWPEPQAREIVELFRHTLETGEPFFTPEWTDKRLDRGIREYYEWRIDRIPLSDGRLGVVCYFRDISQQVMAREEIARSEGRFRAFVTATSDVIYRMSSDWSEMRHLQGRNFIADTHEPSRSWIEKYIRPEDRAVVLAAIRKAIEGKHLFELEHRVIRVDGSAGWTFSRAVPLFDDAGEIVEWFGTARDITERKRTEEELRRANKALEQFAYTASHDLQEPLRTVKIYSELLMQGQADLNQEAKECLDYIRSGASRMEAMVRDLLAYTQTSLFDKPSALAEAASALRTALDNLGGSITESGTLVEAGTMPALPVHATHLQQLFQNLVGNGIKYRRPDLAPHIRVECERQNEFWKFSVTDNGIGIDPEYHERIFRLFERLHQDSEYSGTGIGLAICQRIVERYGGLIWVESRPGAGSTFYFTLPA